MTLYERGSGLLETHVTWQDVELEMQKALGTTATFGKNKKATNISEKKGFISRIALIDPDWICPDESLPSQFIVKISTSLEIIEEGASIEYKEKVTNFVRNAHNTEVFMYSILDKYRGSSSNLRTLKIYYSKSLESRNSLKGFLVAEFVPNICNLIVCGSLHLEDLTSIVKASAALSAIGERMTEDELAKTEGEDFIERTVLVYFQEKIQNEFLKNLKSLLLPSENDDRTLQMIDEFMKVINIYSSDKMLKKYSSISKYLGHKSVLMHSDLWTSNVLFTKSTENDQVALKALIDFQTVSLTSPGFDAAALVVAFLGKNDRRKYKKEILDLYYDTFCEEVLKNSNSIPYTRQQLENSYELMFPIDTIFTLTAIFDFYHENKTLGVDKAIGLLEDVISIHHRNLINFADLFE